MRSSTQLLKDSFKLFFDNYKVFLAIGIIPVTIGFFTNLLIGMSENPNEIQFTPTVTIALVINAIAYILMCIAVAKVVATPTATIKEAYSSARKYFFAYLWVNILMCIIIMLGLILLIIPGIIFMFWYIFSTYMVIFEDKIGTDALRSSKELVKGKFTSIAKRLLFLMLLSLIVAIPLMLLLGVTITSQNKIVSDIVMSALNLISYPVVTAYMYYMYLDLRKEKETVVQNTAVTSETVSAVVTPSPITTN